MKPFIFPFQTVPYKSRIVLYGAGDVGLCFYNQLKVTGYAEVVLWVDKNWKDYQVKKYPVTAVEKMSSFSNYDYVVVSVLNSKVALKIVTALIELGVEKSKIVHSISLQYDEHYINSNNGGLFGFTFPFQIIKPNSNVILYGAEEAGTCFYYQLKATGYANVLLWVDKNHERFDDIPLRSIDKISSVKNYDYVIMALENSELASGAANELVKMNVDRDKIVYPHIFKYNENKILNLMKPFLFPFDKVSPKSKIVLYGAGDVGLCFYNQLKATGYAEIVHWVDKNWKYYQAKDYPVVDTNIINSADCREYDYIILASEDSQDVAKVSDELTSLGVAKTKIVNEKIRLYDKGYVNILNNFVFPFHKIPFGSKVVIYGAGSVGLCFYNQLKATGYAEVVLWVDKNWKNYQAKNYPVSAVEKIQEVEDYDYIVISVYDSTVALLIARDLVNITGNDLQEKLIYPCVSSFDDVYINENQLEDQKIYISEKELTVRDLIFAQYYNDDFSNYRFYDLAVRILAIEEYYGQNQIGFSLYDRLQVGSSEKFKKLIQDYENNNCQNESAVEVDRRLSLISGEDIVSLALYHKKEFINVKLLNCNIKRKFDKYYFWKNNFSAKECSIINDKMASILKELNYQFIGIIWPSAMHCADDIINELKSFSPDKLSVERYVDYNLKKMEFEYLLRALYFSDYPDEYIQTRKITKIYSAMNNDTEGYPVRVFYLNINNPNIGINPRDSIKANPQSQVIKDVKEVFRARYKSKMSVYKFDNILHIGDNYLQNKFNEIIFNLNRDVSDLFEAIKGYDYAILKYRDTRQSPRFPRTFTSSACIDIDIDIDDIEPLSKIIVEYFRKKYSIDEDNDWIEIVKNRYDKAAAIVYLKLHGNYKFFGVDLQTIERFEMKPSFNEECLNSKLIDEVDGVKMYYIPDKWDLLVRAIEIIRKPRKTWHRRYIKEHFSEIDFDLLDRAFGDNIEYKEKVKNVFRQIEEE